jgi:hypothetical protein
MKIGIQYSRLLKSDVSLQNYVLPFTKVIRYSETMNYTKSKGTLGKVLAALMTAVLITDATTLLADHHLSSLATDAKLNETLSANLPLGVVQYYRITVPEAGTVVAYTQGSLNTSGRILNEQDHVYASASDGATGSNFLINVHLDPGEFFIEISSAVRTDSGPYNLVIEFTSDSAPTSGNDTDTFRSTLAREVTLTSTVSRTDGIDIPSSARFNAGASLQSSLSPATSFAANDEIMIAGAVTPLEADRGKAAGIYVVIRSILADGTNLWTYRNSSGDFVPWNGVIASLEPAYDTASLESEEIVDIYSGKLQVASHRIFLGYRASGNGPLHYNQQGLRIDVD